MAWAVSDVQGMEYICRGKGDGIKGTAAKNTVREAEVVTLSSVSH